MDTNFINELENRHLLVAGEVGIDEYLWGDTWRISPEAPVPVVEVTSQTTKLGLSANVAENIVSLGAKTTLVSIRGNDKDGESLDQMIADAGISSSILVHDTTRPTLRKVRILARRQHVVRVDYEKKHSLSPTVAKQFREIIQDQIGNCDGMILQDYGKGLWTSSDVMSFITQAHQLKKPVFVDPSRLSPLSLYKGTTLLTPNLREAETLCNTTHDPSEEGRNTELRLQEIGNQIIETTHAEHVVITCGQRGMVSVSKNAPTLQRIPTFAREVFDVTGAGDTVVAVLALMHVLGYPIAQCMQVANAAAGLVVGRIGTACVTREELREELLRLSEAGLLNK